MIGLWFPNRRRHFADRDHRYGSGIREIARLKKIHGRGRWRKRKGIARVRLSDGTMHLAEIHWYEASGIGRKELNIKELL